MANSEMDIPPNQTLYIRNLNEKTRTEELKKALYDAFSQFGQILDVSAKKTLAMRGQAFIVFNDISSATNALRQMNNYPFFDKPMVVQYAKVKSDMISKKDGSFVPRPKRNMQDKKDEPKPKKQKEDRPATNKPIPLPKENLPPNALLFLQNLPEDATESVLHMLFNQYPGLKECRMVPGKPGIAFVEYENEMQSTAAMNSLQGFKMSDAHQIIVSYAKK